MNYHCQTNNNNLKLKHNWRYLKNQNIFIKKFITNKVPYSKI